MYEHMHTYGTYRCIYHDISLELLCDSIVCGSSRVTVVEKKEREKGPRGEWLSSGWCWKAEHAVNSEHPAMSWGDKKRCHLKLTQLFSCKSRHILPSHPHPFSLSHTLSIHTVYTRASIRPQTHNLPKTAKRATATPNQDQCNNTQGKPTRMIMVWMGHSLLQQNKVRN